MRMVNAAIYGFITRARSDLMTLDRCPDDSYMVMLEGLMVAIEHIQSKNYIVAHRDPRTNFHH